MKLRELRRQCERFVARLSAEGANPDELAGLLIGAHMRLLREQGLTRELYMEACALLWDQNNAADKPVDDQDV